MKRWFLSALSMLLTGAGVSWADAGTPANAAATPGTPGAENASATPTAPRPLTLPGAPLPLTTQAPASGTPPQAPATPGTTTPTAPASPAMADPAGPVAQNGAAASAAPKVDLRDCHIGPEGCWWVNADYLLWWVKQGPLPVALVNTPSGTVLGNSSLNYGNLSGARFEGGTWLNERHTLGFEASFFFLQQGEASQSVASDATGTPALARPIFNVISNAPTAAPISSPGTLVGSMSLDSTSQLWGLEGNMVRNLYYGQCFRADLLAGFRNINLEEGLTLNQFTSTISGLGTLAFNTQPTGLAPTPTVPVGNGTPAVIGSTASSANSLLITDRFGTVNHIYAGQIGGRFVYYLGRWQLDAITKVALGVNHESVNILGQTTAGFPGGGTASTGGGLLAIPNSNYGPRVNDTTDYFTVIPEVRLGIGYQFNRHIRAQVGWNFLWMNGVARPGNHIDTSVNPTLVPSSTAFVPLTLVNNNLAPATGPFAPNLGIRQTDFWAQGINFGLLFTY